PYYYDFDNKIKISNWGGFLVLKNDLNEYLLYNDERSYSEWVENFIKAYSIATSLSEHYNLSDENLDSDSFVSKLAEINKCIKYADSMPLDENKLQDYDISYEQYDVMKEAYYDLKNIEIYEGDTGYGFTNFEYTFPGREYGYNYKRSFERYDGRRNHNICNIDILPEGCLIFN
ncbi:MAG: hypothetical protein KBT27_02590, partial [Prevotellaceae bacterium]|nr:hypothetical protein [Candidatus Faecinaster equi]